MRARWLSHVVDFLAFYILDNKLKLFNRRRRTADLLPSCTLALFPSSSLRRVGHAMQPDVMRSVFAPLNNLFQESAALQRRWRHALLRDVIKNIGRFAFPDTRHTYMRASDGAVPT